VLTLAHAGVPRPAGPAIAWPVIALVCFVTESFLMVHFEHRREAHSISFSAIPLVVGLYTLPPLALVTAVLAASAVSLATVRRQAPVKAAVNVSSAWLETAVAIAVFHALAGSDASIASWPAALAAALAGGAAQALVVTVAIGLYQRHVEVMPAALVLNAIVSIANTAVAIVAVTLLAAEPLALALLALVVPVLFVSYRAHARLREKHRNLEQLYEFSRRIGEAVSGGRVVATLLDHLQEFMHAEAAWICVPAADGGIVRVRAADGDAVSMPMPAGAVDQRLHAAAQAAREPLLVDAAGSDDVAAGLRSLGVGQALIAPLTQLSDPFGTIVIADRSGDVRAFGAEDVKLFATLVSHAGASLENSQLLDKLREHAAASEHHALHDPLTGLPNRTLFGQRVATALQAESPLAVLLLDLDRFKEVNDTLGHHNGDVLLEEVGRRLSSVLRNGDTVARLGGDEFAVLLPGIASTEAAMQVAQGMLAVLERPVSLSDVTISVAGSIGVAIAPDHGDEPSVLLQRADVAMYVAKADQSGVELYEADRDIYSPDRLSLAAELRRAIERGELEVHYQPQIDLRDGSVLGAEALIRWIDESGWRMSPAELVNLAEHTGLIGQLTRFVLRAAVKECSRWWANGWPIRVSVNLAARTLLEDSLADEVRRTLDEFGLPASALCLELTETSIMGDEDRTIEMLERLRSVGVTIAVDDFGVGYSSLAYLARLPVGEIKIDRSFVMEMPKAASAQMIVRSVVDLAANLGIPVVAEGVETEEARTELCALGCQVGQGYLFSRPVAPADFAAWLTGRTAAARVAHPSRQLRVLPGT
jgi:diguanylate cyclase (GGDEF)-like protein